MQLTPSLRQEYETMFASCVTRPEYKSQVAQAVSRIVPNLHRYQAVARPLGVPWFVIALIHNLESSCKFDRHLHNGDPLTGRTSQKPAGRPTIGTPPFTWEESAIDAIRLKRFDKHSDWSIPGVLWLLEDYNGWGYRKTNPEVKTPYLWSMSNHYERGKYVRDGVFDPKTVSAQVGCVPLIKALVFSLALEIEGTAIIRYELKKSENAEKLQTFLNQFVKPPLKVDGYPGASTSSAFKSVFGFYLKGDPRS